MHTFRGRACLLLGLAFLILTGVFFGPGSSGALAQESFALTHGDLYWNSPKSDKESDDTWRIFQCPPEHHKNYRSRVGLR